MLRSAAIGSPQHAGWVDGGHMSAEDNVATVQALVDAINRRALDRIPDHITPGYVRHDLAGAWPGVEEGEGARDFIGMLLAAVPDLQIEIKQIWGTEDRVASWISVTGTHTGEPLLGFEPRGKRTEASSITLYRLEGGRIAESWQLSDLAALHHQLG